VLLKSLIHSLRGMWLAVAGALMGLATVAAAASPDFTIVSPGPGTTVRSPVVLRTTVVDAELGSPRDGLYHLHYSVDGGEEVALYRQQDVSIPLRPGMPCDHGGARRHQSPRGSCGQESGVHGE